MVDGRWPPWFPWWFHHLPGKRIDFPYAYGPRPTPSTSRTPRFGAQLAAFFFFFFFPRAQRRSERKGLEVADLWMDAESISRDCSETRVSDSPGNSKEWFPTTNRGVVPRSCYSSGWDSVPPVASGRGTLGDQRPWLHFRW